MDPEGDSEMLSTSSPSSTASAAAPMPIGEPSSSSQHPPTSANTTIPLPTSQQHASSSAGGAAISGPSTEQPLPTPGNDSGNPMNSPSASTGPAVSGPGMGSSSNMPQMGSARTHSRIEEATILSGPPGAYWKSDRAQEEYTRAMEKVVDQEMTLDEFGDPFDLRDMAMDS